jgi:uncharacterized membrane protein YeaQ/YmgE (transglycosylase-associated protein family)
MLGAVLLGLVAGVIARLLTPGDVFRNMSGPTSWLASIALGLAGAILSAIIGTVIVILIAGFFLRRRSATRL